MASNLVPLDQNLAADDVRHGLMILSDQVLRSVLLKLSSESQVAVERVAKRFGELDVLADVRSFSFENVPNEERIKLVKKMPKLVTVLGLATDKRHQLEAGGKLFIKELAKENKNIISFGSNSAAAFWYFVAMKRTGCGYDGSAMRTPVKSWTLKTLIERYASVEIKSSFEFTSLFQGGGDMDRLREIPEDDDFFRLISDFKMGNNFPDHILDFFPKFKNITELDLEIITMLEAEEGSPDYENGVDVEADTRAEVQKILTFIATFPLKKLKLGFRGWDSEYIWSADDYDKLTAILSIPTLREVMLNLFRLEDYPNVMRCFLQSTNSKFTSLVIPYCVLMIRTSHNHAIFMLELNPFEEFSIIDFILKFKWKPSMHFAIRHKNQEIQTAIMRDIEHFELTHPHYHITAQFSPPDTDNDVYMEDDDGDDNDEDYDDADETDGEEDREDEKPVQPRSLMPNFWP